TADIADSSAGVQSFKAGSLNSTSLTIIQGGTGTGASAGIQISPANAGDVNIGTTTHTGQITVGQSTAGETVSIAGGVNTATNTVTIANGASGAATNVSILSGVGTAGASTLKMANNTRVTQIDLGNINPAAARSINIGNDTGTANA